MTIAVGDSEYLFLMQPTILLMIEILKNYDIAIAKSKNGSFDYFQHKYLEYKLYPRIKNKGTDLKSVPRYIPW